MRTRSRFKVHISHTTMGATVATSIAQLPEFTFQRSLLALGTLIIELGKYHAI